jgi:hypothetical protein
LTDGTSAKALTGIDDPSRMCVCAKLMAVSGSGRWRDGVRAALATHGVAERFHPGMRAEFLCSQAVFTNSKVAQQVSDESVDFYNTDRPQPAMDIAYTCAAVHRLAGRPQRRHQNRRAVTSSERRHAFQ